MGNLALPENFLDEMKQLLPENEYADFVKSYDSYRTYGLRRNPLKYTKEEFESEMPWILTPIPWAEEGYFYLPQEQPGKSIYHDAGAYYIQEPSAMEPVELLSPKEGQFICDLCAAPGGKSSQIAGKLNGTGLLVSNEYVSSRAKILAQNLERMGTVNYMIFNEDTGKLAKKFQVFFDGIVVDAPCSGEGMFRKDDIAIREWTRENVHICAKRQMEILENAAQMLKPGGTMVYSTCTFSLEENEEVVLRFLEKHPEFHLDLSVPCTEHLKAGVSYGIHPKTKEKMPGTLRMWPHKLNGEGHFAARFIKEGILCANDLLTKAEIPVQKKTKKKEKSKDKGKENNADTRMKDFQMFCTETLQDGFQFEGSFSWFGDQLYLIPIEIDLTGMKVERAGIHLGTAKKNRFEPSHTLAMSLKPEYVKNAVELQNPTGYLSGLSDVCGDEKGWTLALVNRRPIGWGKAQNGVLKNHYPKGLRK